MGELFGISGTNSVLLLAAECSSRDIDVIKGVINSFASRATVELLQKEVSELRQKLGD